MFKPPPPPVINPDRSKAVFCCSSLLPVFGVRVSVTFRFMCVHIIFIGGGVAQWLGRRISNQGVPGSNPGRCTFRCGLEQVTFTLLSTG